MVDNTLLGNDRIVVDLNDDPAPEAGDKRRHCYREIFKSLRMGLGYAGYLAASQRSCIARVVSDNTVASRLPDRDDFSLQHEKSEL